MSEYTPAIEACIEAALRAHGHADVDRIAGVSEADAAVFLQRYASEHPGAVELEPGGRAIRVVRPPQTSPAAAAPAAVSPVEQVLSVSGGKSLLDSAPAGRPVSKWLWLLPLSLGVIGGVIAWFIVKDENPRVAKNLLITGFVVWVLSACVSFALGAALAGNPAIRALQGSSGGSTAWPASATGKPTFYYFGSPG